MAEQPKPGRAMHSLIPHYGIGVTSEAIWRRNTAKTFQTYLFQGWKFLDFLQGFINHIDPVV
ncbi:MAG: hypothetical protein MUO77_17960 [Anaerolineales bacterium]|nr:hypothetical protein [Anaerolineales bacterium]